MKIIKSLSTLLIAMGVVLGTSAFAANSIQFSEPKYDGSADTITFTISVADAVTTVGAEGNIAVYYSEDDFSYASSDCATNAYIDDFGDSIEMAFDDDIDTSVNKVLGTITLNVIGDKSKVVGTEFETDYIMYVPDREKVTGAVAFTVAAAGPVGPTVDKVEEETAAGITAYTVSSLANKKIMTKTFKNVAVKPGMGLVVTNNGVTHEFGGDLYAVLGSPAEGTVTIGSLTFGLVVEDTASASQFTFKLR